MIAFPDGGYSGFPVDPLKTESHMQIPLIFSSNPMLRLAIASQFEKLGSRFIRAELLSRRSLSQCQNRPWGKEESRHRRKQASICPWFCLISTRIINFSQLIRDVGSADVSLNEYVAITNFCYQIVWICYCGQDNGKTRFTWPHGLHIFFGCFSCERFSLPHL